MKSRYLKTGIGLVALYLSLSVTCIAGLDSVTVVHSFNDGQMTDKVSYRKGEKVLTTSQFIIDTASFYKYTILHVPMQAGVSNEKNSLFLFSGLRNGEKVVIPDLNHDRDFTNDPVFQYPIRKNQRKAANDSARSVEFTYDYRYKGETISRSVELKILPFEPYKYSAVNDQELMQIHLLPAWQKSGIVQVGDKSYRLSLGPSSDFEANYGSSSIQIRQESNGEVVKFDPELFVGECFELNDRFLQIDSVSLFGERIYLRTLAEDKIEGVRRGNFLPEALYRKLLSKDETSIAEGNSNPLLLVDFWGSWCGPCIEALPHLSEIYTRYGNLKNFDMLSVAWEHHQAGVKSHAKLVSDFKMNWRQEIEVRGKTNPTESIIRLMKVDAFPTTFLIDGNGKILYREIGIEGVNMISKELKYLILNEN